jgi:alpha-beta hydrolase superfamily lysophospholipase
LIGASCAPRLAQQGVETRLPAIESGMGLDGDRYVTRDGLRLGLMHWDAKMPSAIIVGLHGMSDYSNAFSMPAPWWAEHGITTYAYDQRSFGRSPDPGVWAGSAVMRRDLDDFVDVVRALHPGVPVFVLGESMGGAVAMTAFASSAPPHADGLILVAPAVWSRSEMPFLYRAALWVAAHLAGGWSLSGTGLKIMASDNIEVLRANGRDPLFQKSARSDAVYGLVNLMDEAYRAAPRLNTLNKEPVMFLYGNNDQVIPARPTKVVAGELERNATVKNYPNGYHMLLRDLDRTPRWADVANWVEAHAQAMGSGMAAAAE